MNIPKYVVEECNEKGNPVLRIVEGKFTDIHFYIDNINMDKEDEALMHYDLFWSEGLLKEDEQEFSELVSKIIVQILEEQVKNDQRSEN